MPTPERLRELASATDPRAGAISLFFLTRGADITELLLIRHAQIEETMLEDDLHLTELGREQSRVLAAYLAARMPVSAVYASPTARARETASVVAEAHHLDVTTVDALADVRQLRVLDKPIIELLADEFGADRVDAKLAQMRSEATLDAIAPFLESSASFGGRVSGALDELVGRHPGQRVAIVTHGPVIMSYVAKVLGSSRDFAFYPALTSITSVLARGQDRTLDFLNARPHFEAL